MTPSMVERVARALHEKLHPSKTPWDVAPESWRESYRKQARAAIEAMREPMEYMLMSMYCAPEVHQIGDNPKEVARYKYEKKYTAAIDAALKEGE